MYKFGSNSSKQLQTCHPDLQLIFEMAIKMTKIDFSIIEGHRSVERQVQLYEESKTKKDGIIRKSKHNYLPSKAVDIAIYHGHKYWRDKIIYDTKHLSYVAGIIMSCADILHANGDIEHLIRWGGNWDNDGVLMLDQSFQDLPHFELIKAPSITLDLTE